MDSLFPLQLKTPGGVRAQEILLISQLLGRMLVSEDAVLHRASFSCHSTARSPLEPWRAEQKRWCPEHKGCDGKGESKAWNILPNHPILLDPDPFSDLKIWGHCSEAPPCLHGGPSMLAGLWGEPFPSTSSGPGTREKPTTQITIPSKDLIQIWRRNQKLYRQAKAERMQHHQTSSPTNAKGSSLGRKHRKGL